MRFQITEWQMLVSLCVGSSGLLLAMDMPGNGKGGPEQRTQAKHEDGK
jgi:hypothetical protein